MNELIDDVIVHIFSFYWKIKVDERDQCTRLWRHRLPLEFSLKPLETRNDFIRLTFILKWDRKFTKFLANLWLNHDGDDGDILSIMASVYGNKFHKPAVERTDLTVCKEKEFTREKLLESNNTFIHQPCDGYVDGETTVVTKINPPDYYIIIPSFIHYHIPDSSNPRKLEYSDWMHSWGMEDEWMNECAYSEDSDCDDEYDRDKGWFYHREEEFKKRNSEGTEGYSRERLRRFTHAPPYQDHHLEEMYLDRWRNECMARIPEVISKLF